MSELTVHLGPNTYSIHIGAGSLQSAGPALLGSGIKTGNMLLVTDENVDSLYGDDMKQILADAGWNVAMIAIVPGEASKNLQTAETLYTAAIQAGLDRHSPIVAFGGGVVGDLAGFVAATFLRGVPFVQIPTTLLAQVDSSVGGKVAVDHPMGKNLIGAFYQPRTVIIDPLVLGTLPDREFRSGMGEVIKYGVMGDQDFLRYLNDSRADILSRDHEALERIILRSCAMKARIVEQDEKELGLRMVLNLGHTIGHAVEIAGEYQRFTHGEAVAVGMHGAALLSRRLGYSGDAAASTVKDILQAYGLPSQSPFAPDTLLPFLSRDKKVSAGKIQWVLLRKIGETVIGDNVPMEIVREVLSDLSD